LSKLVISECSCASSTIKNRPPRPFCEELQIRSLGENEPCWFMSPMIATVADPFVVTPSLAWLKSVPRPPLSPNFFPFQAPLVAISTPIAGLSAESQHPGVPPCSLSIAGYVHQLATRSDDWTSELTSCHGATCRLEGLANNLIAPPEACAFRVLTNGVFPVATLPSPRAIDANELGPLVSLTNWGLEGSVTTLAVLSAVSTASVSDVVKTVAKKCCETSALSSLIQPRVLPCSLRGMLEFPFPGQSGVVTCITNPLPSLSHARTPLECPQGAEHEFDGEPSHSHGGSTLGIGSW